MENIKEYIKNKLVELYQKCSTDKYGQVGQFNFTPDIFGNRAKEVEQYCRENKGILNFALYGGKFGTYTAFTVEDAELRKECSKALSTNKNHLRNLNSW